MRLTSKSAPGESRRYFAYETKLSLSYLKERSAYETKLSLSYLKEKSGYETKFLPCYLWLENMQI